MSRSNTTGLPASGRLVRRVDVGGKGRFPFFDDAVQTGSFGEGKQAEHFTHKVVTGDLLKLSDAKLAAFGYHILARLNASKPGGGV